MENFNKEVKMYMIFDLLGDLERTGPLLWKIERNRLEDVKDHIFDLILMVQILKKYLPENLDYDKINEYIICHDLPEAITGDITEFEGITKEEKEKVTTIAIEYLEKQFNDIFEFSKIINNYDNKNDLEAKIVYMLDKIHSASAFIKYQSEQDIDMDNPDIIPELRNHPFVVKKIAEGMDLADIFFEYHLKAVSINEEECQKYNIKPNDADKIVNVIKTFATEMYTQKQNKTLLNVRHEFPKEAMKYKKSYH